MAAAAARAVEQEEDDGQAANKGSSGGRARLDLSRCGQAVLLERLAYAPGLRELTLRECGLQALPVLPSGLERLDVSSNALKGLEGLARVPNLLVLDCSSNVLRSLAGLDANALLQQLSARRNRLKSVAGVEHLRSLTVLDVAHNRIASLQGLRTLSLNISLAHLVLEGNPLRDASPHQVLHIAPSLTLLDGRPCRPASPRRSSSRQPSPSPPPSRPRSRAGSSAATRPTPAPDTGAAELDAYQFELFRVYDALEGRAHHYVTGDDVVALARLAHLTPGPFGEEQARALVRAVASAVRNGRETLTVSDLKAWVGKLAMALRPTLDGGGATVARAVGHVTTALADAAAAWEEARARTRAERSRRRRRPYSARRHRRSDSFERLSLASTASSRGRRREPRAANGRTPPVVVTGGSMSQQPRPASARRQGLLSAAATARVLAYEDVVRGSTVDRASSPDAAERPEDRSDASGPQPRARPRPQPEARPTRTVAVGVADDDETDTSAVAALERKVQKLYTWHVTALDLIAQQQRQINDLRRQLLQRGALDEEVRAVLAALAARGPSQDEAKEEEVEEVEVEEDGDGTVAVPPQLYAWLIETDDELERLRGVLSALVDVTAGSDYAPAVHALLQDALRTAAGGVPEGVAAALAALPARVRAQADSARARVADLRKTIERACAIFVEEDPESSLVATLRRNVEAAAEGAFNDVSAAQGTRPGRRRGGCGGGGGV